MGTRLAPHRPGNRQESKVIDNNGQPSLTLFSIPKPFEGHNRVIQLNAINSWMRLKPSCEIILFGDDHGTAEVAAALGLRHVPDVERNEHGTPLVSSMFMSAQKLARHDVVCYINADIILLRNFLPALHRIKQTRFLVAGQRWDIDINELLDLDRQDWEARLRDRLKKEGSLHPRSGIDYFVFPRGLYKDMPPLAIGRGHWDNWLIYRVRKLGTPLIDATEVITAVHQNHDYAHAGGADNVWKGPEIKRNIELAGGIDHAFSLDYATHRLTARGLERARKPRDIYFRLRAIPMMHDWLHFLLLPLKWVQNRRTGKK
jgi:hypothetical protein